MELSDVPAWVWQVLGAMGGLTLGLGLGAWHLKRGKNRSTRRRVPARTEFGGSTGMGMSTQMGGASSQLTNSRFPESGNTPQQRLMEHLRQSNLDLGAQLRASAAQHGRLLKEKEEEAGALKDEYEQQVEALRQAHSQELKHLMTLLVEQVDGIHKAHANHVKALEAEIERIRQAQRRGGRAEEPDTTTFAPTETMGHQRPH